MRMVARRAVWTAGVLVSLFSATAAADYDGVSGYPSDRSAVNDTLGVSHSGYPSGELQVIGEAATAGTPNYVVIETEDGQSQEVDGQTVIVVQEPAPIAASEQAPPPAPKTTVVVDPAARCPNGIWVEGYWSYADGRYGWVDGHCVIERVNYVFVHPRWDFYANVWWFVPGYYRPCSVWVGYGYHRPWYYFPPYHRPYYRGYRAVPVYRRLPSRPTVARPVPRTVGRVPVSAGRIPRVSRTPSYGRAPTVVRTVPARSPATSRVPTRAGTVTRVPTSRTSTVDRVPGQRGPTVTPVRGSRAPTVVRGGSAGRTRSSAVQRSGVGTARSPAVARPATGRTSVARPRTGPSRSGTVARPGFGGSRGASFGRPSMAPSRPSFGRPGGFSRPSSGGPGGRAAPVSRGR